MNKPLRTKRFRDAIKPASDYLKVEMFRERLFVSYRDFRHGSIPDTAGVALDREEVVKLAAYLFHFLELSK